MGEVGWVGDCRGGAKTAKGWAAVRVRREPRGGWGCGYRGAGRA